MSPTLSDAWYERDRLAELNHYADNLIEAEVYLVQPADPDFDERPYNPYSVDADGRYAHPNDELF